MAVVYNQPQEEEEMIILRIASLVAWMVAMIFFAEKKDREGKILLCLGLVWSAMWL